MDGTALTLADFNSISRSETIDEFKNRFKTYLEKNSNDLKELNQQDFSRKLITYLFGVINRREDIQGVIEAINDLTKASNFNINLSSRFLFAFMMEISNVELRNRLVYYMSETFAVPLIYRNQISYEQS